MEFGVLGPLSVEHQGKSNVPSAPKLRTVLAMLLVHSDQVVPVSSLITDLWDELPPASGLTTLQTYVLNLRKYFVGVTGMSATEVAKQILITRPGGYLLHVEPNALDMHRYEALVDSGLAALANGNDEEGIADLDAALRTWRGPALVDIAAGRVLESKALQLSESRLVTIEYMLDAELRLGRYREVLSRLAALCAEHPLNERLHAQYMRALHLSGRRAQALEVFHRLRVSLVNELGLDPERSLQELHAAILGVDDDAHILTSTTRPAMLAGAAARMR
ncbi:DNA-binding SARP family transcriptional activator [Nocardia tenerifensis]|uniref:DNA-binding SARP family transcriptional activator n=1 Tax=Nocardia tenerifensis TaxID=228006 RepID=A0A318KH90_9NOCA|nr:DNA-binding SARP family transcriptional activator [Nocardia tenerifensis]